MVKWMIPAAAGIVLILTILVLAVELPFPGLLTLETADQTAKCEATVIGGYLCKTMTALVHSAEGRDATAEIRPFFLEARNATDAAERTADALEQRAADQLDTEGYTARRLAAELKQAADRARRAIRVANSFIENGPAGGTREAGALGDVPHEAITAEVLIVALGGDDFHREPCGILSSSDDIVWLMQAMRHDAMDSLRDFTRAGLDRASQAREKLWQSPARTDTALMAAAEDLRIRQEVLTADFDALTRQAAIRLFGMAPD